MRAAAVVLVLAFGLLAVTAPVAAGPDGIPFRCDIKEEWDPSTAVQPRDSYPFVYVDKPYECYY